MIEKIKKEIEKDKYTYWVWKIDYRVPYISKTHVMEILDKYKDKFGEKKYTLEELQYVYEDATRNKILEDMVNLNNQLELCLNKISELEKKHGIEVE